MTRRLILSIAVLALAALVAAPTVGAGQKRTRDFDVTLRQVLIDNTARGNLWAGDVKGKPVGRGATLLVAKPGADGVVKHRGTAFFRRGTIRIRGTNTLALESDGTVTIEGSGKIVGGTGRYRGARGPYTLTGSKPPDSSVQTIRIEGDIRY